MVKSPTWKKALDNLGWESFYQNADEHTAFLAKQQVEMATTLKEVGLVK